MSNYTLIFKNEIFIKFVFFYWHFQWNFTILLCEINFLIICLNPGKAKHRISEKAKEDGKSIHHFAQMISSTCTKMGIGYARNAQKIVIVAHYNVRNGWSLFAQGLLDVGYAKLSLVHPFKNSKNNLKFNFSNFKNLSAARSK